MAETVLVTGGCGFIGANFVRHMLERHDHNIINLDKLTYAGNLENLEDIAGDGRYTFVRGASRLPPTSGASSKDPSTSSSIWRRSPTE